MELKDIKGIEGTTSQGMGGTTAQGIEGATAQAQEIAAASLASYEEKYYAGLDELTAYIAANDTSSPSWPRLPPTHRNSPNATSSFQTSYRNQSRLRSFECG